MIKSTYIKTSILTSLLAIAGVQTQAQNTIELSLDTVVAKALTNNWQVKKTAAQLGMAKADLMQSNAAFLPNINISETFVNTTDPLNVFGFKLKQEIVTAADFNPPLLNDPDAINNFTTRIAVEQPILNFDAFAGRGAAASSKKASELNLQWTKNLIALKAKSLYFNLQLATKQKDVLKNTLVALQENHQVTQNFYNEGMIQKVSLLEMELQMNGIETTILETENQINDVNLQLTHFLGMDMNTTIVPTDSIQDYSNVNIDQAGSSVSENRSDLQALAFQLKATNRMLNSSKMGFLPRLNAFGSYEWNEDNVFGTLANNYMIGAKLEWDIFKGGKNIGKFQKMKHQQNIMQISYDEKLSDSQRKLVKVKQQLKLSKKHVELSQLAVAQAEEAYKIKSDRYTEGLEKTADILASESLLLNKKLTELKSVNYYQQLIFNLELLLEQEIIKK
jgi:outer membrane protein TolC